MNAEDKYLIEQFMRISLDKLKACLIRIHTINSILIENKIVTSEELEKRWQDSEKFPEKIIGTKMLEQMINDFNISHKEKS